MLGRGHLRRRRTVLLAALLAVAAVAGSSGTSASSPRIPPPGTFAIGTTGASVQVDPALAYITTAWEFEYMTCAKLVNYPDTPWGEQDPSRLRPEIAASMPTISADRRTYTFQIRDDYAFSPPWSGVVTAAYGLVFGLVAAWRRSIIPGAIAHAIVDIMGGLRL